MQIFRKKQLINYGGRLLDLSKPVVMGILNITPDSFYDFSRVLTRKQIRERAEEMIKDGVTIIDLGGYSSRPTAKKIRYEEEYKRIRSGVLVMKKYFPDTFISVDTFCAEIVRQLYEEFGHFIINDISAGEMDENMIPYAAKYGLPYIAMHMRGTPETMQNDENCSYQDIVTDIITYFVNKQKELLDAGVVDMIFDPGFGFAKTLEGNYEILAKLSAFKILEQPILVGMSRKSMFYKPLACTPEHSLDATIAGNMVALQNGADILRVHDVKAACDTIKIFNQLQKFA